ncbi:MAG: non-heme iron oxygenase ferredoxin subunit [Myxococcota bacterium]|nr:non-heme iron oxygenase ferredoxin subunit [Myxococcota bacterium]
MDDDSNIDFEVSDLEPGQTRAVEHDGLSILVCNVDGTLYAVENLCSHAQVPLAEGELRGCEIECIFHGATFDVRTGEPLAPPAIRPIRTFKVVQEGDRARIEIG